MANDWLGWVVGPLIGAAATGAVAWMVERRLHGQARREQKQDKYEAKVDDHERRISVLEIKAGVDQGRRRRAR